MTAHSDDAPRPDDTGRGRAQPYDDRPHRMIHQPDEYFADARQRAAKNLEEEDAAARRARTERYLWPALWAGWALFFLVVEGIALFRKQKGDTFSEQWWSLFRVHQKVPLWARLLMLAAQLLFLGWLVFHLPFGLFTWSPT